MTYRWVLINYSAELFSPFCRNIRNNRRITLMDFGNINTKEIFSIVFVKNSWICSTLDVINHSIDHYAIDVFRVHYTTLLPQAHGAFFILSPVTKKNRKKNPSCFNDDNAMVMFNNAEQKIKSVTVIEIVFVGIDCRLDLIFMFLCVSDIIVDHSFPHFDPNKSVGKPFCLSDNLSTLLSLRDVSRLFIHDVFDEIHHSWWVVSWNVLW